ncbi:MAG: outer membrane protein assembly factor BamD [Bacteroidales bacterium]
MFRKIGIYLLISVVVLLAGCSEYQKISKSQDFKYKYEKAMEYYERNDYYRALSLFDQVMPFYRGADEAEEIAYKYAYAYYYQKEYIMAGYYFDRFAKTYPRNEKAEECAYMSAYCKYLESPDYKLDQKATREAIDKLQLYINAYPNSERVAECNKLIDELREKLQKKDFEIAKLYFKMDSYEAAVTSFELLLKDYPDTRYREDALFYTIRSYYFYAMKSVRSKRADRLRMAAEVYEKFTTEFPDSKYKKEVAWMYERAMKEINKNNNNNS